MKKFSYHLQKILDLKEKEKEQAEWAFGKSVQKKTEEEAKLERLNDRREALTVSMYAIQDRACTAAQLIEMTRYRDAIDKAIVTQQNTLYGCEQEMELCQRKLTFKMQETRLWEQLKAKEREKFEDEYKQREQKELDEIGLNQYMRR